MRTIIGQLALGHTVHSDTVELADALDAVNFANGLIVRVTCSDEPHQPCRQGRARVTSVSQLHGTVTFSRALSSSIPAFAAGDFIVLDADEPSWL